MKAKRIRASLNQISVIVFLFFSFALISMLTMVHALINQSPASFDPIYSPTPVHTIPVIITSPTIQSTQTEVKPLNKEPIARIQTSLKSGTAPLKVELDASASLDPEGSPLRFEWDCGRGIIEQGRNISCNYPDPGAYTVRLTVSDDQQAYSQNLVVIQVNKPAFLAKNIILFIGDGMGFEHVRAGGMYLHGLEGSLSYETFPHQAEMTTYSEGAPGINGLSGVAINDQPITDSAAAATAMATGVKVYNGVVSLDLPGNGDELYTLLEYARDRGLSTGLVTTTTITHATMAGFGAHALDRTLYDEIAADYLNQTRPNVLFGGGGYGMTVGGALVAGYQVVDDLAGFQALLTENLPEGSYVSGQFGYESLPFEVDKVLSLPGLSQMTEKALAILDNDPDGFFLVVEGGRIDHASHNNQTIQMVGEVAGLSNAVQLTLDWAKNHPDTLILVVADHETGGLHVEGSNGPGNSPDVIWTTSSHTGLNVPIYLFGPYSGDFPNVVDNTDIPGIITEGQFPGN